MRVALLGDFGSRPDEGMRKTAQELARRLEALTPTHRFDLAKVGVRDSWRDLRAFAPDALLYVPGPSMKSLALLRLAKRATGARVSAGLTLNPEGLGPAWLVKRMAPEILFVHSNASEARFRSLGLDARFLPVGVDVDRFRPASPEERAAARETLGIPSGKPVVLHVGHLKRGRNLAALAPLAKRHQVVVVGSTATEAEAALADELRAAGVLVIHRYLPDVQAAYHAADAYAFPTTQANNSTEIPLSILEALACGLPVVSTPYGAVPRLFSDAKAVRLGAPETFLILLEDALADASAPALAREAAQALSWDAMAKRVLHELSRGVSHG